jgi:hypothetical protein
MAVLHALSVTPADGASLDLWRRHIWPTGTFQHPSRLDRPINISHVCETLSRVEEAHFSGKYSCEELGRMVLLQEIQFVLQEVTYNIIEGCF